MLLGQDAVLLMLFLLHLPAGFWQSYFASSLQQWQQSEAPCPSLCTGHLAAVWVGPQPCCLSTGLGLWGTAGQWRVGQHTRLPIWLPSAVLLAVVICNSYLKFFMLTRMLFCLCWRNSHVCGNKLLPGAAQTSWFEHSFSTLLFFMSLWFHPKSHLDWTLDQVIVPEVSIASKQVMAALWFLN